MKYAKPPLSYQEQATLLIRRGMAVADHSNFLRQLEAVGYYRLCAYWHPFKRADKTFEPGTSFEAVWRRYAFDRHLRLAVVDGIERVEVAVRSALITDLAMRHGAFAHLAPRNFPSARQQQHTTFVDGLRREANRSREAFVGHFRANYDEFPDLPIWAAAETMTFGAMFTLFNMSERRIQRDVARRYGIAGPVLTSWLPTLNYVRNMCAHHARLWNRELAIKPALPDLRNGPLWHQPDPISNHRVFAVLTLLRFLLGQIAPQSLWRDRLYALFDSYPEIPLVSMTMTPGWREHPLWK